MRIFRGPGQIEGVVCKSLLMIDQVKGQSGFLILMLACLFQACGPTVPQWQYGERILLNDAGPYGIAFINDQLVYSSPSENIIGFVDDEKVVVTRETEFVAPRKLNMAGTDLFIAESGTDRVAIYSDGNTTYYPLVKRPDDPMAVDYARSVVVVADYNNHRIIYYNGSDDRTFGSHGVKDGQFKYPTDVQIFANRIYVADNMNNRIQVFDMEGEHLMTIGENGGVKQASGLYVSSAGIILCDRKGQQVFWYDHQGKLLQRITEGFETPSDAVIAKGTLYVSDEDGGFIAVLTRDN